MPEEGTDETLNLIRRQTNYTTTICGTLSASTLGLAFLLGRKHGYLIYSSILSVVLLRNQIFTVLEIGEWIHDRYQAAKEFAIELYAKKTGRGTSRGRRERRDGSPAGWTRNYLSQRPRSETVRALNRVGAASFANCVISGIAFGMASIGVFGDMD